MALFQHSPGLKLLPTPSSKEYFTASLMVRKNLGTSRLHHLRPLTLGGIGRGSRLNASKIEELLKQNDGNEEDDDEESGETTVKGEDKESLVMDADERREWRHKIREVMSRIPDVEEEIDMVEKRKKMHKLLAEYPLVVEEEDPDWPEDADGWGFNLGQFFDKISIKNVKKDEDDDGYNSGDEIVWQDDDYIRPIKDITAAEWEEAVFKDISPLVVLVHNRYKRPKENEKIRDQLEKAVHIIWNCQLPSPRCVAIDANLELDLVSALHVSVFPELIFTKAGKILYREKAIRTADELSKIMAFFYYGAAKPPCLARFETMDETGHAIASALNVVQTSHSYGDLMLLAKAEEAKQENPALYTVEMAWVQWSLHLRALEAVEFLEIFLSMNPDAGLAVVVWNREMLSPWGSIVEGILGIQSQVNMASDEA